MGLKYVESGTVFRGCTMHNVLISLLMVLSGIPGNKNFCFDLLLWPFVCFSLIHSLGGTSAKFLQDTIHLQKSRKFCPSAIYLLFLTLPIIIILKIVLTCCQFLCCTLWLVFSLYFTKTVTQHS